MHFERFTELFSIRGAVVPLDEALALICHFADEDVEPQAVIADLDQLASTLNATSAVELMAELFGPSGFTGNSFAPSRFATQTATLTTMIVSTAVHSAMKEEGSDR